MRSSIFLSYASEQSEAATHIELSLKGDGYSVFRDRTSLPPGESFDARILAAIEESDLFIFLISHESISHGRYTLTELKFAEQKWGHPAGHVLPVLVEPVPKEAIPIFLQNRHRAQENRYGFFRDRFDQDRKYVSGRMPPFLLGEFELGERVTAMRDRLAADQEDEKIAFLD